MSTASTRPPARSAVLSPDGAYRYHLHRRLSGGGRAATFILLNPSTADHLVDDPTTRRCIGFARRWGCDELHIVNLFAVRATDPAEMRRARDPVGPDNRTWVMRAVDATATADPALRGVVVCAWGVHGSYMGRNQVALGWLEGVCEPMALGITRDGHPRHPLHVPYSAGLARLSGRSARR